MIERLSVNLFLLFTFCLLSGTGCTGSFVEEGVEKNDLITLSFASPALELLPITRSTEAVSLPVGSTIRIAAYHLGELGEVTASADFSVTAPTVEATFVVGVEGDLVPCQVDESGKQIAGKGEEMRIPAGRYDFYAVSPARPLTQVDGKWQVTDIPHQEDVMTSFVRGVEVSQVARVVTLRAFRRKCAQVVFEVAPTKGTIVPISSLCGTRLELSAISSAGASLSVGESEIISPSGGDRTDAGKLSTTDFVTLPDSENPDQPNPLGLNRTTTILLPKNSEAFGVAVTVARNGIAVKLEAMISKNIVFEEGKQYVFTLEVENDRSLLRLSVYDWSPFGWTDHNIGGAPSGRPTEPEVTPGTPFGLVVADWENIPWTGGGTIGGKKID